MIVQDVAKRIHRDEYDQYEAGDANLVIVSSCVPTKTTLLSDKFTYAFFEFLEKNESKDTQQLVLPDCLLRFNHRSKSEVILQCSGAIQLRAFNDFITMAIGLL